MKSDIVERLVAYLQGKLSGQQLRDTEREVKSDPDVKGLYLLLCELIGAKAATQTSPVARAARKMSRQLFRDFIRARQSAGLPQGVVVFDSRYVPLPQGVRPAAVDTRRLKYKLEAVEVEIALYPVTPDSYELMGQVTGLPPRAEIVVLLKCGRSRSKTTSDEFQVFRFTRVPALPFALDFRSGDKSLGIIQLQP